MRELPLYKKYENTKPIGVCAMSAFGGLEVLDIVGDVAIAAFNFSGIRQKIRCYTIQYTDSLNPIPYIRKAGIRFYLGDTPNSANVVMRI